MNEYFLKIKGKDIKSNLVNLSHLVSEVRDASQQINSWVIRDRIVISVVTVHQRQFLKVNVNLKPRSICYLLSGQIVLARFTKFTIYNSQT